MSSGDDRHLKSFCTIADRKEAQQKWWRHSHSVRTKYLAADSSVQNRNHIEEMLKIGVLAMINRTQKKTEQLKLSRYQNSSMWTAYRTWRSIRIEEEKQETTLIFCGERRHPSPPLLEPTKMYTEKSIIRARNLTAGGSNKKELTTNKIGIRYP